MISEMPPLEYLPREVEGWIPLSYVSFLNTKKKQMVSVEIN